VIAAIIAAAVALSAVGLAVGAVLWRRWGKHRRGAADSVFQEMWAECWEEPDNIFVQMWLADREAPVHLFNGELWGDEGPGEQLWVRLIEEVAVAEDVRDSLSGLIEVAQKPQRKEGS
jgi:hypothetical protein